MTPFFRRAAVLLGGLALLAASSVQTSSAAAEAPKNYDVVVYAGTPGGVMAAVAAGRQGHTVALVDMNYHIGGMISGGLTDSDIGDRKTVGGLSNDFFNAVVKYYTDKYGAESEEVKLTRQGIKFEPHVAEEIFLKMLVDAHVDIFKRLRFNSATLDDKGNVASLVVDDLDKGGTRTFTGKIFIDASYEGDLMAAAKVPYTYGREARDQYNEYLAGVSAGPDEGKADKLIMSYNYRVQIAGDPNNLVPFPKPEAYDPEPFKKTYGVRIVKDKLTDFTQLLASGEHRWGPRQKLDLNWGDLPSATEGYADGDWATREKVAAVYRNSFQSMLYYFQNDPELPAEFHAGMQKVGLPKDEFVETGNFPFQLYVREARRMIGQYVLTEKDITQDRYKTDGIAEGSYGVDCHLIQNLVIDGKRVADKTPHIFSPGYDIPYGCLVPADKPGQPTNLIVPVCCSTSHVAYCSLRMEPVFMMLGHASGDAAHLALADKTTVQKVDVKKLRDQLLKEGAQLDWNYQPQIKITWTPEHPATNQPIHFKIEKGEIRDPLTNIWWDFAGNGKVSTQGEEAQTQFNANKVFNVSVLVEDAKKRRLWVRAEVPVGTAADHDVTLDDMEGDYTGLWDMEYPDIVLRMIPDVFYGIGQHFAGGKGKHAKDVAGGDVATFRPNLPKAGRYELCIACRPDKKQATNVPVTIQTADGPVDKALDQKNEATPFPFVSLGEFRFPAGATGTVQVKDDGADGRVIVDAVRWVWMGD